MHALTLNTWYIQFTDGGEAQMYYGLEGHLSGQGNQPGNESVYISEHFLIPLCTYVGMLTSN